MVSVAVADPLERLQHIRVYGAKRGDNGKEEERVEPKKPSRERRSATLIRPPKRPFFSASAFRKGPELDGFLPARRCLRTAERYESDVSWTIA